MRFRSGGLALALVLLAGSTATTATTASAAVPDAALTGSAGAASGSVPTRAAAQAQDRGVQQGSVVSAVPSANTPHVLDGRVLSVAEAGNLVILGGRFTQVASPDRSTVYTRNNLVAFNKNTGEVSTAFAPQTDGDVEKVVVAEDGASVYVGGRFNQIDGSGPRTLARLKLSDGSPIAGFTAPSLNGRVRDMELVGGRLWIAGNFAYVAGHWQPAVATLDPATGGFDPYMRLEFAEPREPDQGLLGLKLEASPAGDRMAVIGNFTTIEGQRRYQIGVLGIDGDAARLADWNTEFFTSACSSNFHSYMRDVDYSPDGSHFVVVTTGGYGGGPPAACDTSSRFETYATGRVEPTWVEYTGGDTTLSVESTGTAVYTGGHFRWQNNPRARDVAGAGAVSRPGLASLDPVNGNPFRWNPTRTLGVGVFDLVATSDGLWMTSDTDRVGDWLYRGRVAFFPLAGGSQVPHPYPGELPGEVYTVPAGADDVLQSRGFDGNSAEEPADVGGGGIAWDSTRGAFMLDDRLYLGMSDGSLVRRDFDGQSFGDPVGVDTADQIVPDSLWDQAVRNSGGMFFHNGRIYYTDRVNGGLYWRAFTPESDVVDPRAASVPGVPGLDWSRVRGMMVAGDRLYFGYLVDGQASLRSVGFVDGRVTGQVETHQATGWNNRSMFLFTGDAPANRSPQAAFNADCEGLVCSFAGGPSSDPDGTIASYEWNFGDGSTGEGASVRHVFDEPGDYTVRLTVTDDGGATGTTEKVLEVRPPSAPPTARFDVTCDGLSCEVDGSGSTDSGSVDVHAWEFGDGGGGDGATAAHAYASDGTYDITLTVTDDEGETDTATKAVTVADPGNAVRFVGAADMNANRETFTATVPTSVAAGDQMLLFLSLNSADRTIAEPSGVDGWTRVGEVVTGSSVTKVWRKKADPTDAGGQVSIDLSAYAKGSLTLTAYRGPNVSVQGSARTKASSSTATYRTPTLSNLSGGWLVSYWSQKSSATTAWTGVPAGNETRSSTVGSGGGRIASLLVDSGRPESPGTVGGIDATADAASGQATMWSFLIGPSR